MKIGLIDVDGHNFPNLALMKLSAWHKQCGDTVEWCNRMEQYDLVYMSKVFDETYSPDIDWVPMAKHIIKGGTGYIRRQEDGMIETYNAGKWRFGNHVYGNEVYREELPWQEEHTYPDYSMYPELTKDTAYGYLTRGCPRNCAFCLVSQKEGRVSRKVADLSEFWRGQKYIKLMDPNILACREHLELLGQLADSGAYVDFTQGLDARLLNKKNVDLLNKIKVKEIHFAWDDPQEYMEPVFQWYAEHAVRKPHGNYATVYVLVNYWSAFEDDLRRIYTLDKLGYNPYVMIFNKPSCDPLYLDLQRWCNLPAIRKKCPKFEDYKKIAPDENQMKVGEMDEAQ
ncbi:MAG: radical SAM protein [Clostridia bacterium]|nr:radical SAM protein [Clostridia bacterium]